MTESQHFDPNENMDAHTDLIHYVRLFWRSKFFIVGLGLLFSAPTIYVVKDWPNTYSSTASLSVEANKTNITNIEGLYGFDNQSRNYASTQYEILKSRNLAERVIDELNLLENPEISPVMTDPDSVQTILGSDEKLARALNYFGRHLDISPVNNTSIVKISFSATDPQLAADVANQVALSYIEQDLEQRISATQQASTWLAERADKLREDLQASETKLNAYLERERLVDIGGVEALKRQEIDGLATQLIEVQRTRREAENIFLQVKRLESQTSESLLTFPAILNNGTIQEAKQNADQINQEIAELSNRYGRNHPRMIALRAEAESAQQNLAAKIQQQVNSLETQYQTALENERATAARLEESKAELLTINSSSFERQQLEREVETNRQLYQMFFTRIRETQETDDLQNANATIVDPAVPAMYPTGPQRRKTVLLALLAGLALGGGLVLLKDLMNNTASGYLDLEQKLRAHVLGTVPLVKIKKKSKKNSGNPSDQLKILTSDNLAFKESFRTIRTGLILSSVDNPHKIIGITSSIPGEVKTTVAVNLATSLALMGSRVLLIDADLRRPNVAKYLGLPPDSLGLTDYLIGSNPLRESLFKSDKSGMTILPAGEHIPDPLALLSSNIFQKLLETLSTRYDYIVLDTPPTVAVSDALILSRVTQAMIFVVRAQSTPMKVAKKQISRLVQSNANLIGVVLNQLDVKKTTDYGGYYDSYHYSAPPPPG